MKIVLVENIFIEKFGQLMIILIETGSRMHSKSFCDWYTKSLKNVREILKSTLIIYLKYQMNIQNFRYCPALKFSVLIISTAILSTYLGLINLSSLSVVVLFYDFTYCIFYLFIGQGTTSRACRRFPR